MLFISVNASGQFIKNPQPISGTHAAIVATDMMRVLSEDWPPARTSIYIEPLSHNVLEDALRSFAYSIDRQRQVNSIPASLRFLSLPNDNYQAVLTMNSSWRLSRLYQMIRTELHPATSYALSGGRGVRAPLGETTWNFTDRNILEDTAPVEDWYIDAITSLDESEINNALENLKKLDIPMAVIPLPKTEARALRLGPIAQPIAARNAFGEVKSLGYDKAKLLAVQSAVVVGAPTTPPLFTVRRAPCTTMTIKKGSLRENIQRLTKECGYSIGAWQFGNDAQTKDWVISKQFVINSKTGIYGLLDFLLTTYGIDGVAHASNKIIDFGNK